MSSRLPVPADGRPQMLKEAEEAAEDFTGDKPNLDVSSYC